MLRGCRFALFALALAWAAPALHAATMTLESAEMGAPGQGVGPSVSATNFVGWRFNISKSTVVSQVGGHLGAINGNLFAAIVSLTAVDALPVGAPFAEGTVKASTTFVPPATSDDFRVPLGATLAPGSYAMIFGSGQFGATGKALVANAGQANIAPTTQATYISWRQSSPGVFNWAAGVSNNIRFVVVGSEIAGATDFNIDGKVDANDVPVWKAGFGNAAPAGVANGDANADGIVDGADFLAWQRTQSPASTPATALGVPEPSAFTLAALLGIPAARWLVVGFREAN